MPSRNGSSARCINTPCEEVVEVVAAVFSTWASRHVAQGTWNAVSSRKASYIQNAKAVRATSWFLSHARVAACAQIGQDAVWQCKQRTWWMLGTRSASAVACSVLPFQTVAVGSNQPPCAARCRTQHIPAYCVHAEVWIKSQLALARMRAGRHVR